MQRRDFFAFLAAPFAAKPITKAIQSIEPAVVPKVTDYSGPLYNKYTTGWIVNGWSLYATCGLPIVTSTSQYSVHGIIPMMVHVKHASVSPSAPISIGQSQPQIDAPQK